MNKIEQLRAIVRDASARKVDGVLVDVMTASAIVQVHDALSTANQVTFVTMPIEKMGTIAWKLMAKHG